MKLKAKGSDNIKHYAIIRWDFDGEDIVTILSDKQKAENYAKILDGQVRVYDDNEYESFCNLFNNGYCLYRVCFFKNKNFRKVEELNSDCIEFCKDDLNTICEYEEYCYECIVKRYYVDVMAKDKEHAEKIALDIMEEYKHNKTEKKEW